MKLSNQFVPVFSIITICLNNKIGLIRTHESIISQSYNNFEWLVIDGESTDGTLDFLRSLPVVEHIKWISEPDSGLYDAMNKGIERAFGNFLLFLNSGDELADSDTLDIVKSNMIGTEYDLIYGDALENKGGGQRAYKKAYSYNRKWYGMFTHHQAMFFRKGCIAEHRYDLSYKIASDYAFTCALLEKTNKVKYIESPICLFEGGGLTSTTAVHIQGLYEQWRVAKEILNRSFLQRVGTLFLLLVKHALMRLSPALYDKLRYKKVS